MIIKRNVNMSQNNKKYKKLKIAVLCLIILFLSVYVVIPVGFGYYATLRYEEKLSEPPENFTKISLSTLDQTSLAAWYTSTQNGASIILLHGATGSREGIKGYAEFLKKNGFGVLAFDMRGHGESEGDGVNGYGWNSTDDIMAATEYLSKQSNVKSIGGLGLSLGGEALLGAASTCTQLEAIATDGATYRTIEDYLVLPSRQNIFRSFTTHLMFASAQLFGGTKPPGRLVDSIAKANNTSFLFIAAGRVEKEIEYSNFFVDIAKERAKLWIVDDVEHTEAYTKYSTEYENKIIEFFNKELLK